jgi:hypothetical protein
MKVSDEVPLTPEKMFDVINATRRLRKSVPQGLKPDVFSIIYGPTKVVP